MLFKLVGSDGESSFVSMTLPVESFSITRTKKISHTEQTDPIYLIQL